MVYIDCEIFLILLMKAMLCMPLKIIYMIVPHMGYKYISNLATG